MCSRQKKAFFSVYDVILMNKKGLFAISLCECVEFQWSEENKAHKIFTRFIIAFYVNLSQLSLEDDKKIIIKGLKFEM